MSFPRALGYPAGRVPCRSVRLPAATLSDLDGPACQTFDSREAMVSSTDLEQLRTSLREAERVQQNLDQRVFHLKTLYDVSRDIFASVESEKILKSFLLMTMGNFGILEGFVLLANAPRRETHHFLPIGIDDADLVHLEADALRFLAADAVAATPPRESICIHPELLRPKMACVIPFEVEQNCRGVLGLGPKVVGERFSQDDQELLFTLVNNLVVALRNARSFEEIEWLNRYLKEQNIKLEHSNTRLSAALRKVEMLESIKSRLSKFVPTTVCRMIEKSPAEEVFESREQDVSVLFLDIEGYTKICERLSAVEVNRVIESHFSQIVEAIHANHGDINETAGDGLMVLFLDVDPKTNALEAVRTAVTIQRTLSGGSERPDVLSERLVVNVGINSGAALVGAAKFDSYAGSRWTYTARGMTTNIAARIGALATGGKVLLSGATANRVKDEFDVASLGKFRLKNVSEEVEIFSAQVGQESIPG
ncbi:MAG: adenylate/guanylate cyclase domain-containing protein [Syntrophobacteraceae bacterium]